MTATRSPLLVKASREGRTIVEVTPKTAGWRYVGFRAIRLAAADVECFSTADSEVCIVVLTGTVDVTAGAKTFRGLGHRDSVFESMPPAAVYAARGTDVSILARRDCEVAICSAPSTRRYETRVLDTDSIQPVTRGKGSNARHVLDILPENDAAAEHLLVVEVVTPAGHASSYPPHKHDREAAPEETQLEETYYHRLNPEQGFAFQRVYTDDRSLDEAIVVENHDTVMVPRGYHPCVAPHGYDLYYLNVMAGPGRQWRFRNDPVHEWMLHRQT
jgi:5-deoxy-glucuronate isomerase